MPITTTDPADSDPGLNDLGPLAWVLDELRKSLDGATKAMHRFVRDAEIARGSNLSELDASHLRVARQQLHQAVGALEMVGMAAPAKLLHAMESAVQKFVQRPELCSDDAALRIERASFALTEFLEGVLKGRQASSVALFPQYRAVMELAGAERIHPADLWPPEWRWLPVELETHGAPLPYVPEVRAVLDQSVLKVVKTADPQAAARLAHVCAGLSTAQSNLQAHSFWAIAAGYFQAMGLSLLPADVYTKRTASRILQQYAALAKGESSPSERLAQDLVFFCAQAQPPADGSASALSAVRSAYALSDSTAVDYQTEQFGRFDPAQLALARKRIASAAETWSALAGGDAGRIKQAVEQFAAVGDSVLKLHPKNSALPQELQAVMDATARAGVAPSPEVAMEVATSVLYLEAAYEDLDPTDDQMVERSTLLATRLAAVSAGAEPEPLEPWMEELYRRVSDRQTMGSVVDELRAALGEVETALDRYFRNPTDKTPLRDLPSRLAQMRGVFSVLGLDQPALATLRMRSSVDQLLMEEVDVAAARTGVFERLGNSLGALGLLIDMLSYQRAMAKKLFVYDEQVGEFKPLMGRERSSAPAPEPVPAVVPEAMPVAPVAIAPEPASTPAPASASVPAEDDEDDAELQEIFLEEAREVVVAGQGALRALATEPSNLAEQTTLRRAFHTLKGSARMVGLNDFGEAAWAFEQLLNAWLAEQKPASDALVNLSGSAMAAFACWIEDIAGKAGVDWQASEFRRVADALRLEGRLLALSLPGHSTASATAATTPTTVATKATGPDEAPPGADFASTRLVEPVDGEGEDEAYDFVATQIAQGFAPEAPKSATALDFPDFAATQTFDFDVTPAPAAASAAQQSAAANVALGDFDFADIGNVPAAAVAAPTSAPAGPPVIELDFPPDVLEAPEAEPEQDLLLSFDLEPEAKPAMADEPVPEPEPVAEAEPEFEPEPEPEPVSEPAPLAIDEQTKVIGDLRLSIPLYNVYLNEADEWSRRLITELSEWALELHRPVPDSTVGLAHSLGGASATVGFAALAEVARSLEHALDHVQLHGQGNAQHAQVFSDAAEDIRRLLHQFAAGFLKSADPRVLMELRAIISTPFAAPESDPLADAPEDFDEQSAIATQMSPLELLPVFEDSVPESEPEVVAQALPVAAAPPVQPAPVAAPDALDRGLAAQDRLDTDLFPIFQEEAAELMPALGVALRQWVARPDNLGARAEALRVLHTLKGSARLAGALRLGEMAHRMESGLEKLGTEDLQTQQLEPLLGQLDSLQATLDALDLLPTQDISQLPTPAAPTAEPSTPAAAQPATPDPAPAAVVPAAPVSVEQVTRAVPRNAGQTVRVRSQLLDRLVNQAGEVMISRSRMDARIAQMRGSLGDLTGNLERLRQQLRDIELQAESQMQSRLAQSKDDSPGFDPLEFDRFTRVQELTRMMAESVNDVATVQRSLQRSIEGAEDDLVAQGRQARELQRDLLRTRMVEFEGISERLYGVVRQSAKAMDKQVKLEIVGGQIEMDRGVLDRMTPAFEHILRNAVAHGIEDAAVRQAAGKPAQGHITISVQQESNDVTVSFADDGGGLHLQQIRARAIANKLIQPDAMLGDAEAANLLFTPGFSTATEVTELSGRGIGMDVVLTELNALGGRVETSTETGKGTRFRLILPLTTAVTQVVMLRMGDFTIGVPSNLIETVLRAPAAVVEAAYARGSFALAGQEIGFYWGGALLQVSGRSQEPPARNLPVAVFRSAGQRLALHVDEVLGNREVVVKNLGPQLARMPGLAGMSVLASGAVVLIYNPVALATVYGAEARNRMASATASANQTDAGAPVAQVAQNQPPLVLVVDDSITVRRVTQRLLKREGFRVALANDGLHALEVLAQEKPAVVLSDIEMPRMDGFDLVRNIRADEGLRDLPVIMITSRIAQKHRDYAEELGVDHYLGKPYAEDALLALIRAYCAQDAEE